MTVAKFKDIVERHGLTIDEWHGGAGKFRDIYVGTGKSYGELRRFAEEIRRNNILCVVEMVNNPGHTNHNQWMATVQSFWWDE